MGGRIGFWAMLLATFLAMTARSEASTSATHPGLVVTVPDGRNADPGELVSYCVAVTSTLAAPAEIVVSFWTDSAWPIFGETGTVSIVPGEELIIPVSLLIPTDAPAGSTVNLEMILTWPTGIEAARISLATMVNPRRDLSLSGPAPAAAPPGARIVLPFLLTNRGNISDVYICEIVSAPPGWTSTLSIKEIELAPEGTATISVSVDVPSSVPYGSEAELEIRVISAASGQTAAARASITASEPAVDGWARIGSDICPIYGEAGLSYAKPANEGVPSLGWLRLWSRPSEDEQVELLLSAAQNGEFHFADSFFLYRTPDLRLRIGGFASFWNGLVDPGTGQGGLDFLTRLGSGWLELIAGTPDENGWDFEPQWYGLTWSLCGSGWDLTTRLLQTGLGPNAASSPYLDASIAWRGEGYALKADLAANMGDTRDNAYSLTFEEAADPFGWRAGYYATEDINHAGRQRRLSLGGIYQWDAHRRLNADFSQSETHSLSDWDSINREARFNLYLGPYLHGYAQVGGVWSEEFGWALGKTDYILGVAYGTDGNRIPRLQANLEIFRTDARGAGVTDVLLCGSNYQFHLGGLDGLWQAGLQGSLTDGSASWTLELSYDAPAERKPAFGFALGYEYSRGYRAGAEVDWEVTPATRLAATTEILAGELTLNIQLRHRFEFGVPRPHAMVTGRVFQDLDGNRLPGSGEPGLAGIWVSVDGRRVVRTGPDGGFTILGLAPGRHLVEVDMGNGGSDLLNGNGPIVITPVNGGHQELAFPVIRTTDLTGRVFIDRNGDGRYDPDDAIIAGLPLLLGLPDGTEVAAASARDGTFLFCDLPPGSYVLRTGRNGLPEDVIFPEQKILEINQEGSLNVDLAAFEKEKPLVFTYTAPPQLVVGTTPVKLQPGTPVILTVQADMPMTRIEVTLGAKEILCHWFSEGAQALSWTGQVMIPVDQKPGKYTITIKAWNGGEEPGAAAVDIEVMAELQPLRLHVPDEPTRRADLRINSYPSGSAELDATFLPVLAKVAADLKAHEDWGYLIVGHTDNTGGEAFNLRLSLARALKVQEYLVEYCGIDRSRLAVVGRGYSEPLASNDTAEGRRKNRRVGLLPFRMRSIVGPFAPGSAVLPSGYERCLAEAAACMQDEAQLRLAAIGYADPREEAAGNLALDRAANVLRYLVESLGIGEDRLYFAAGQIDTTGSAVPAPGGIAGGRVEIFILATIPTETGHTAV